MCVAPLTAYHAFEKVDGKKVRKGLTFRREASYSGIPIKIGCGQCIECRMKDARQVAIRGLHEARMHPYSQFVTLTYDDKNLPHDHSLDHRDFQLFMKKLRKSREPTRLKFMMCGEYGEQNARPHYHSILYSVRFPDQKLYKRNGAGDPLYQSKELSELWGKGLAVFGAVTFQSCAYISGYILKKVKGKDAWRAYCTVDADGIVTNEVLPEYRKWSNGLGRAWFDKYGAHAYEHDSLVINGREVKPPRYYDELFIRQSAIEHGLDDSRLDALKRKRARLAYAMRADNTSSRKRVKEVIALRRLADRKKML